MEGRMNNLLDWQGRHLPPMPPWPGYSRPAPRSSPIRSKGRGGPIDFKNLETKLGKEHRVLYEVEPETRRRVLVARLNPPGEQVVIVSDIINGHSPQFPQVVIPLPDVGKTQDFIGNPLPKEAMNFGVPVRTRPGKGGRSLHELAGRLAERKIRLLWETEPDEFKHTARRVVVYCCKCRHVWSALVCNLDGRETRCPCCAASKSSRIEELCRRYLRLIFGEHVSQAPRRDLIPEIRYKFKGQDIVVRRPELDIVIEKSVGQYRQVAIEVHGEQHYRRGWSGSSPEKQIAKDRAKSRACMERGILLIEIPYTIFDDEQILIADEIRRLVNHAAGEELIQLQSHKKALKQWSIDDFGRQTEVARLQENLKRRVSELGLEVLSPLNEVTRTSSRILYRCPYCKSSRSAAVSTILKQSGLCHSCAKVVPEETARADFWTLVENWCLNQNYKLLSRLGDYHGKSLKAAKFYFLDDRKMLRAVFCFTISRPVVEKPRARSLVSLDKAPVAILARIKTE